MQQSFHRLIPITESDTKKIRINPFNQWLKIKNYDRNYNAYTKYTP
ncbi:hypothetical protein M2326_003293 [Flavobacterium sp. 7A]|nr:hypothetical protein [Flavobacterium sp. 7A]